MHEHAICNSIGFSAWWLWWMRTNSGAAGEVHRLQSAVSMQLKKLEDAVDTDCWSAMHASSTLPPEGETLLGYARHILELHAEAHDALGWRRPHRPGAAGGAG